MLFILLHPLLASLSVPPQCYSCLSLFVFCVFYVVIFFSLSGEGWPLSQHPMLPYDAAPSTYVAPRNVPPARAACAIPVRAPGRYAHMLIVIRAPPSGVSLVPDPLGDPIRSGRLFVCVCVCVCMS